MAKDNIGNLIKFTDYKNLQTIQKPNKNTEIGGFSVFEELSVENLLNLANKKTGEDLNNLKKLTINELKNIIYNDSNLIIENLKKSNAEKKFIDMIYGKKKNINELEGRTRKKNYFKKIRVKK